MDHKIITKVSCEERHSFLPLYNQKNGATTVLRFQLELIEERSLTHTEIEENRNQGQDDEDIEFYKALFKYNSE